MGSKKRDYRGYEIWEWEEGEKTSQKVYTAVSKGKQPELAGYMKTVNAVKKLIDRKLDQPPEKVEDYKGVEILYLNNKEMYQAKIGSRTTRRKKIEQIRRIVDKKKN